MPKPPRLGAPSPETEASRERSKSTPYSKQGQEPPSVSAEIFGENFRRISVLVKRLELVISGYDRLIGVLDRVDGRLGSLSA